MSNDAKNSKAGLTNLALLIAVTVAAAVPAQAAAHITAQGRELTATDEAGRMLWNRRIPGQGVMDVRPLSAGKVLVDGKVEIAASGRLISVSKRPTRRAGSAVPLDSAAWDTPASFGSQYADFGGPKYDGLGHAWAVLIDGADNVSAVSSTGDSAWGAPQLLGAAFESGQFNFAVDVLGNVTVIYRSIGANYELLAARYTTALGWSDPQVIYQTPTFFQTMSIAGDAAGNAVAAISINDGASTEVGVYSAATASWGAFSTLPLPAGAKAVNASSATVSSSPDGQQLALAYAGYKESIEVYPFNRSSLMFGTPVSVPGTSSQVPDDGVGQESSFVIDDAGDGSLIWAGLQCTTKRCSKKKSTPGLLGSYEVAGVWKSPIALFSSASVDDAGFSQNFSSLVIDAEGSVIGSATNFVDPGYSDVQNLLVYSRQAGAAWQSALATTFTYALQTYSAASGFGSGAVAVFLNADSSGNQYLDSVISSGSAWSEGPTIPGDAGAFGVALATSPSGNVAMLFNGYDSAFADSSGIYYSWLRP